MTTYIEKEVRPAFITRMRRLSKSNFTAESQLKNPRLDKMIAHVSLFDKTTRCLEDELTRKRADDLAASQTHNSSMRKRRPGVHRTDVEVKETPEWLAGLTARPATSCVVVTEIEHAEDMDD